MLWAHVFLLYVFALTSLATSVTIYLLLPSIANSVPRPVLCNWLLRLAAIDVVLVTPGLVAISKLMSGGAAAQDDWSAVSMIALLHILCPLWVTVHGLRSLERRGPWFGKTTLLVSLVAMTTSLLTWGSVPSVVSLAVMTLACTVFISSFASLQALVHHAQDTAQGRSLAPVVYLRSFDAEHGAFVSIGGEPMSLETFISEAIRDTLGPLVAFGDPYETIAFGTSARRYAPDTDWQQRIVELLVAARAIVVLAGNSASLSWELDRIRELGLHTKLFILTPFEVSAPAPKPHGWMRVAAHVVRLAGIRLPSAKPRALGCPGLVALLRLKGCQDLPDRFPPGAVISFSPAFAARSATYGSDPTRLVELMRKQLPDEPVCASVPSSLNGEHERQVDATARRNPWYWVFRYIGSSPYSVVAVLALVVAAVRWLQGSPPTLLALDSCSPHGGPLVKRVLCAVFGE